MGRSGGKSEIAPNRILGLFCMIYGNTFVYLGSHSLSRLGTLGYVLLNDFWWWSFSECLQGYIVTLGRACLGGERLGVCLFFWSVRTESERSVRIKAGQFCNLSPDLGSETGRSHPIYPNLQTSDLMKDPRISQRWGLVNEDAQCRPLAHTNTHMKKIQF